MRFNNCTITNNSNKQKFPNNWFGVHLNMFNSVDKRTVHCEPDPRVQDGPEQYRPEQTGPEQYQGRANTSTEDKRTHGVRLYGFELVVSPPFLMGF